MCCMPTDFASSFNRVCLFDADGVDPKITKAQATSDLDRVLESGRETRSRDLAGELGHALPVQSIRH